MRLFNWVCVFPLALIAVSFAVSNRDYVTVKLWPLPFLTELPLALVGFLFLFLGFLLGGLAVWVSGYKKRKLLKAQQKETVQNLKNQIKNLKEEAQKVSNTQNGPTTPQTKMPLIDSNQQASKDATIWEAAEK